MVEEAVQSPRGSHPGQAPISPANFSPIPSYNQCLRPQPILESPAKRWQVLGSHVAPRELCGLTEMPPSGTCFPRTKLHPVTLVYQAQLNLGEQTEFPRQMDGQEWPYLPVGF